MPTSFMFYNCCYYSAVLMVGSLIGLRRLDTCAVIAAIVRARLISYVWSGGEKAHT